ncbi:response regulator transcription factor [Clostridium beijerinckii]|uniref:response regulator transcription factor n=1 Tax=Clostridium beijerinckii TaxID=1520 RepID=UPI00080A12C8|nr:response regulator transcription factor [Clostridium beijerinckii]OCA97599.1 DNA-binding response regulator [Clostridium beijerinckii]
MVRILIVEDDMILNKGLTFSMKQNGYDVISVLDGRGATIALSENKIDLIILDINLPDKSGLDLCIDIRKNSIKPILFLTAKDTEEDIIKGFKAGCDDYIAKPFSIEVLKQRVNAVLRRSEIKEQNVYKSGVIKIDFNKMEIKKDDKIIKLAPKEYKLLELLVKNNGKVLKRETILEKLWDVNGEFIDSNSLSVTVKRLREKIEEDTKNPQYVITVFGIGYMWSEDR